MTPPRNMTAAALRIWPALVRLVGDVPDATRLAELAEALAEREALLVARRGVRRNSPESDEIFAGIGAALQRIRILGGFFGFGTNDIIEGMK